MQYVFSTQCYEAFVHQHRRVENAVHREDEQPGNTGAGYVVAQVATVMEGETVLTEAEFLTAVAEIKLYNDALPVEPRRLSAQEQYDACDTDQERMDFLASKLLEG